MKEVFVSWSGGKDGCLAGYLAAKEGLRVRYLANMITEDGKRSWSHGQSPATLQVQAQAMGIPLVQQRVTRANYEAEFKNMIHNLKQDGIG
ncbi:MAG: ATPase, partial [Nanoarchaeota archaeon]